MVSTAAVIELGLGVHIELGPGPIGTAIYIGVEIELSRTRSGVSNLELDISTSLDIHGSPKLIGVNRCIVCKGWRDILDDKAFRKLHGLNLPASAGREHDLEEDCHSMFVLEIPLLTIGILLTIVICYRTSEMKICVAIENTLSANRELSDLGEFISASLSL